MASPTAHCTHFGFTRFRCSFAKSVRKSIDAARRVAIRTSGNKRSRSYASIVIVVDTVQRCIFAFQFDHSIIMVIVAIG